jgi:hypothetical protein
VRVEKNGEAEGRDPHKRAKVSAAVNQSKARRARRAAVEIVKLDGPWCRKFESFAFEVEYDDIGTRIPV